jgi:hypothetical protein
MSGMDYRRDMKLERGLIKRMEDKRDRTLERERT